MKHLKFTKGSTSLVIFVLVAVLTILFMWLGPLLPSETHTDVAVPVMLAVWLFGIPFSLAFALASRSEVKGREAGRSTLNSFKVVFALIILISIFSSMF